jgi:D-hydroxyproline dehydrogenase subunit beta
MNDADYVCEHFRFIFQSSTWFVTMWLVMNPHSQVLPTSSRFQSEAATHDVVIVGGGIIGLSFAWQAAKAGRSVLVVERERQAMGATTRNFGMIWPIGQPLGPRRDRAQRSRALWLELGALAQFDVQRCGSLHVACAADEARVLSEFADRAGAAGHNVLLLDGEGARSRFPNLRSAVRLAMFSDTELVVDPREVPSALSAFLREQHSVAFRTDITVIGVDDGLVRFANGDGCRAGLVIVCPGDDMRTLFPDLFRERLLRRCKLQMQRTAPQPNGWRFGPHLAGGLTLLHYEAFANCPSLPDLVSRMDEELPEHRRLGIHVMMSQNARGECVIGDSHEYEGEITQFESDRIDALVTEYLRSFVRIPDQRIEARWSGFYAKDPTSHQTVIAVDDRTVLVSGLGGAGMTLGPVTGEELWPQFSDGMFADTSANDLRESVHV